MLFASSCYIEYLNCPCCSQVSQVSHKISCDLHVFTLHRMFCSKQEVIEYATCVMFVGSMMMDNFMQAKIPSLFFLLFEIQDFCCFNLQLATLPRRASCIQTSVRRGFILYALFVGETKQFSTNSSLWKEPLRIKGSSSCTRKQDWKNHQFSRILDLYFFVLKYVNVLSMLLFFFFFFFFLLFHIKKVKSTEINAENVIIYI